MIVNMAALRADDALLDLLADGYPAPINDPVAILLALWRDEVLKAMANQDADWRAVLMVRTMRLAMISCLLTLGPAEVTR